MAYLEGQLRRRTEEAENEHTGYLLEVEVDMSAADAGEGEEMGRGALRGEAGSEDILKGGKSPGSKLPRRARGENGLEE